MLKSIMPTYNSMPKSARMTIKSKVKQFLMNKLGGSEDNLSTCIMWARSNDQIFSTYGIPGEFEDEFKDWAIKQLRSEFGLDQVPVAHWEV